MSGHTVGDCEICGRQADLVPVPSLICPHSYSTCICCNEASAESWRAIANFLRESEWTDLEPTIKAKITVWQDETYVPVELGVRRLIDRQVTVADKKRRQDAERENDRLIREMRAATTSTLREIKENNPKGWFRWILAFFFSQPTTKQWSALRW